MKKVLPLQSFFDKRGRRRRFGALDEWLSQRSAKPSTAVRIRHAPLKMLRISILKIHQCSRQPKGWRFFYAYRARGTIGGKRDYSRTTSRICCIHLTIWMTMSE